MMNDVAREALVQASLQGAKQTRGTLLDMQGGRCAMMVIYDALGDLGISWYRMSAPEFNHALEEKTQMTARDRLRVSWLNDHMRWDFLQIARKYDTEEDPSQHLWKEKLPFASKLD